MANITGDRGVLWAVKILPHSVQLGNFSYAGNLAILQVGPRSGYKMYVGPPHILRNPPHILRNPPHILRNPPHILRNPPTASIISCTSMEATKLKFGGCLVDVWIVSGGYLKGVCRVS